MIEKRIGIEAVPRILCVTDNEQLLLNTKERLKKSKTFWVEHIEELILFNLDKNVWDSFGENRQNINGESLKLT